MHKMSLLVKQSLEMTTQWLTFVWFVSYRPHLSPARSTTFTISTALSLLA